MDKAVNNEDKIVPKQEKGSRTGANTEIRCKSREEALILFRRACDRLLDVNNWHKYTGPGSATFHLTDQGGTPISSIPIRGNYIRIDLPGPGPESGDGYDWVRIEAIREDDDPENDLEFFAFRVRPAANPQRIEDATSHFYTEEATSTFMVQRAGHTITAAEMGRNEVPNTEARHAGDKVRNTIVALGAMTGLASVQWKGLMNGILYEK